MIDFIDSVFENRGKMSVIYKCIYGFGFIMHTFFLILFIVLGIDELVGFNIFSVLLYVIGSIFISEKFPTTLWMMLLYVEIVTHSIMCCFSLGWHYGFSLYPMMLIPLSYFVTYTDKNFKKPILLSTLLSIGNMALMTTAKVICYAGQPKYVFSQGLTTFLSSLNMIVSDCALAFFALLFVHQIRSYMESLTDKNRQLDRLANFDPLTSLRNRHSMSEIFNLYEKNTKPFCVILGDIDNFKNINDTFGHSAGDLVLKQISAVIMENIGSKGVVCRWGGEEILIIVDGNDDECFALIEKTRNDISELVVETDHKKISVTMTYGFTDYSEETTIEKLITTADKRLYFGKKNGKNQTVYHHTNN